MVGFSSLNPSCGLPGRAPPGDSHAQPDRLPVGPSYIAAPEGGVKQVYEVRTINGDVRPYPPREEVQGKEG